MKLKIALIRHGETENGNDGALSESGQRVIQEKCAAKAYPALKRVYSCDLACCLDTASLIYPFPTVVLKELRMTGHVDFAGQALQKSSDSRTPLNVETLYLANVTAGNIIRKVGAEMEIKKSEQCAFILRKMVILEILRRYCVPRSSYGDWEIPYGGGYLIEYDTVQETAKILSEI